MTFNYYGLMLLIAVTCGFTYATVIWYRQRLPAITKLLVWTLIVIPVAILGSRLWTFWFDVNTQQFVLTASTLTEQFGRFFGFSDGSWQIHGLSAHGGILFGTVYLLVVFSFYSNKYQISLWKFLDTAVKALLIIQIIGRWGNFFNQELLSAQAFTNNYPADFGWIPQWFASYIQDLNNSNILYHPLFLYESLAHLGLLMILLFLPIMWTFLTVPWKQNSQFVVQERRLFQKKPIRWWNYLYYRYQIRKQVKLNYCYFQSQLSVPNVEARQTIIWWWWYRPIKYQKFQTWNSAWKLWNQKNWWQKCFTWFPLWLKRDSTKLLFHYGKTNSEFRVGNCLTLYLLFSGIIRISLQTMRRPVDQMAITTPLMIGFIVMGIILFYWTQWLAPRRIRSHKWWYEFYF